MFSPAAQKYHFASEAAVSYIPCKVKTHDLILSAISLLRSKRAASFASFANANSPVFRILSGTMESYASIAYRRQFSYT